MNKEEGRREIVFQISYTGTKILQKNFIAEGHVRKRNKGELPRYAVEEMYEPLVSVEDFERAQAIRQRRAEELPEAHPTKFSGLVKCGNCGSSVCRRTANGKKKWVCNTKDRKGKAVCDLRHLPEEELEAAAEKAIGATGDEEFRRIVRQICIYNDRIEFLTADGKTKSVTRTYGGFKHRNGFSGKLFCAECGSKLTRYTWCRNGIRKQSWGCSGPRDNCSLKWLPEEELRRAAGLVLGTKDSEPAFAEKAQRAVVSKDSIRIELKDGTVKTCKRE